MPDKLGVLVCQVGRLIDFSYNRANTGDLHLDRQQVTSVSRLALIRKPAEVHQWKSAEAV